MRALSLEYHDVVEGDDFDASGFPGRGPASYKLGLDEFERHLEAIATSVNEPPGRAVDWLGHSSAGRSLFLTFDDGGVSAISCIAGALERRGWSGHFFVTAGRIGMPGFLSAAQILELHNRGHVIGTHSFSHPPRLGGCSPAQILDEWRRSTNILGDILGQPVLTGSVPGGFYTRQVGQAAARAGLKVLFTSAPTARWRNVQGCRVLGRYTLRRWSRARTAASLAAGSWLPRACQWTLYSALDIARTVGGDHYTSLRQTFWARRD
jgi:peptidoglycan/xylan/chitin deacetylase (PgdA/CDA1 family)